MFSYIINFSINLVLCSFTYFITKLLFSIGCSTIYEKYPKYFIIGSVCDLCFYFLNVIFCQLFYNWWSFLFQSLNFYQYKELFYIHCLISDLLFFYQLTYQGFFLSTAPPLKWFFLITVLLLNCYFLSSVLSVKCYFLWSAVSVVWFSFNNQRYLHVHRTIRGGYTGARPVLWLGPSIVHWTHVYTTIKTIFFKSIEIAKKISSNTILHKRYGNNLTSSLKQHKILILKCYLILLHYFECEPNVKNGDKFLNTMKPIDKTSVLVIWLYCCD